MTVLSTREAHEAVGDVLVPDTEWDELIIDRATRAGFASLDRADLVSFVQVRASVMNSTEVLAWCLPFGTRVVLTEADLGCTAWDDARVSRAWKLFLTNLFAGVWSLG